MTNAAHDWHLKRPLLGMDNVEQDWEPAWFHPPMVISKANSKAALTLEESARVQYARAYPTLVRKNSLQQLFESEGGVPVISSFVIDPTVEMKCLHILLVFMKSSWSVHWTRIERA